MMGFEEFLGLVLEAGKAGNRRELLVHNYPLSLAPGVRIDGQKEGLCAESLEEVGVDTLAADRRLPLRATALTITQTEIQSKKKISSRRNQEQTKEHHPHRFQEMPVGRTEVHRSYLFPAQPVPPAGPDKTARNGHLAPNQTILHIIAHLKIT